MRIKNKEAIMTREHELALAKERSDKADAEVKRLETLLFKLGAMNDPPCFCCGYNGPGYFDVKVHPCADRHHKLCEVGERY